MDPGYTGMLPFRDFLPQREEGVAQPRSGALTRKVFILHHHIVQSACVLPRLALRQLTHLLTYFLFLGLCFMR